LAVTGAAVGDAVVAAGTGVASSSEEQAVMLNAPRSTKSTTNDRIERELDWNFILISLVNK
jgi:hypothetical protein